MKRFIKYSIATLLTLVIGGCSGNSDSSDEKKAEALVIGESVEVQKGDTLYPANEQTQINVEHIIGEDIKKVTLLAGEATLIYGDYNVEERNSTQR